MSQSTIAPANAAHERTFLGHPVGLYVLFLAQMWERFSYFGMLALLILYLNHYLKLTQGDASTIFKWYTSAIYFTPLFGAYVADRLLGNKRAVLLGAALMAVGHFLMAFPSLSILYTALICLVVGCGLLTAPLTTQVGLLYRPGDPRRDSAYTIFYMGINLGAFLSPLLCGWMQENTRGGFHSGFTLAGIGMVIALLTYLVGLRWIVEIDQRVESAEAPAGARANVQPAVAPEGGIEQTPSVIPRLSHLAPALFVGLGSVLAVSAPIGALVNLVSWDTVLFLELAAIACVLLGWITGAVKNALRDRVLAIVLLIVFSIFYWAGAGQYGNAISLWAEQNTDRYLASTARDVARFPEAAEAGPISSEPTSVPGLWERWAGLFERLPKKGPDTEKSWGQWWTDLWSPMPTAWFQSVNPLLILVLAPFFATLWMWLSRRGLDPSLPTKICLGLVLMAMSFTLLTVGAQREAQETRVALQGPGLPAPLVVNARGQVCLAQDGKDPKPFAAGRLFYDQTGRRLRAIGVFPGLMRDEIAGETVPADFPTKLIELQKKAAELAEGPAGWSASIQLPQLPPGFDLRYAGFGTITGNHSINYDPDSRTLTTTIPVDEKEIKGLKTAAGDPALRAALDDLMVAADAHRVSPWWLLGFFLLATMGELCLAPVGMSMVSQLAPARFATMLMSLWLLTFSFGYMLAGAFGEKWGTWSPVSYFTTVAAFVGGTALLLFAIRGKMRAMMHEAAKGHHN